MDRSPKNEVKQGKTKQMIYTFTNNYQFSNRTKLNETNVEVIEKTKLLGTVITNDLKWEENTYLLVRKANTRMQLLQKMCYIYKGCWRIKEHLFIRSILEQSCVLWHSSLTVDDSNNLERVQKSSLKIILQDDYEDYESCFQIFNLQSSVSLQQKINFVWNTAKHEKFKSLFPKNPKVPLSKTRSPEHFQVNMAFTDRYKTSSIPFMQRLVNKMKNTK